MTSVAQFSMVLRDTFSQNLDVYADMVARRDETDPVTVALKESKMVPHREKSGEGRECGNPEEMTAFFDARAAGYDDHMRDSVFTDATFAQFYQAVSAPIEETDEPLNILDLGCGTGLEIEALLQRVPNVLITGVDLSKNMLERLRKRYINHMDQITLVADSYLTMPFEAHAYDHIISAMSVHHLLCDTKRKLYMDIHAALKPGGKYIEGDCVTLTEMESQFLADYEAHADGMPKADDGHYHIDVPFSIGTQRSLLLEAGFRNFEVVWQRDSTAVWNAAVYVVNT